MAYKNLHGISSHLHTQKKENKLCTRNLVTLIVHLFAKWNILTQWRMEVRTLPAEAQNHIVPLIKKSNSLILNIVLTIILILSVYRYLLSVFYLILVFYLI